MLSMTPQLSRALVAVVLHGGDRTQQQQQLLLLLLHIHRPRHPLLAS